MLYIFSYPKSKLVKNWWKTVLKLSARSKTYRSYCAIWTKNISRYEKLDRYIVVFLGINAKNPEELLKVIRENDTENDWTHKKDDEWMLRFCKNVIDESERIKEDCEKYGFYYFNTFENREYVLNQVIEIIKELEK